MNCGSYWKKIGVDMIVQVFQCLDCDDLETLQVINVYFRNMIVQREPRVWKNAQLPLEAFRSPATYFDLHPGQKHVGTVQVSLTNCKTQFGEQACVTESSWRQVSQYLDRVEALEIQYVLPNHDEMNEMMESIQTMNFKKMYGDMMWTLGLPGGTPPMRPFAPVPNSRDLLLQQIGPTRSFLSHSTWFSRTLRLLHINSTESTLSLFEPHCLPALRELWFLWMNTSKANFFSLIAHLSKLTQVLELHLNLIDTQNARGFRVTSGEQLEPFLTTMIQLQYFKTNLSVDSGVMPLISTRLPHCQVVYVFDCLYMGKSSSEDENMLRQAQMIDRHTPNSVVICVYIWNPETFDALMRYTSNFRQSLVVSGFAKPEQWLLNHLERWSKMSTCAQLNKIDIECRQPTRFDIDCVRQLRPIYKQLRKFRLCNLILSTSQLAQLNQELEQMIRLEHRNDCLDHITINDDSY